MNTQLVVFWFLAGMAATLEVQLGIFFVSIHLQNRRDSRRAK